MSASEYQCDINVLYVAVVSRFNYIVYAHLQCNLLRHFGDLVRGKYFIYIAS